MSFRAPSHAADRALVRRALRGKRTDLEELLEHMARVPGMVRSKHDRLGSPLPQDQLDDVVQDTLTAVWSKLSDFDGRSTLSTWIFGFCVNELLKHTERARKADYFKRGDETQATTEEDRNLKRVEAEYGYLYEGLERLGPPGSDVIQMRHFEQLEFGQIAENLGVPTATAKTYYYRAMRKMAEWLGPVWRAEQV